MYTSYTHKWAMKTGSKFGNNVKLESPSASLIS